MKINKIVALALMAFGQFSVSLTAVADEASLKKAIEIAYPKFFLSPKTIKNGNAKRI